MATSRRRTCDSGRHAMDPNWKTCPYCEAERSSKEPSKAEPSAAPPRSSYGPRRKTKVMPAADEATPPSASESLGRLLGFLVTYTWSPVGDFFVVREGKNYIGAGKISSEGHRDCDICLPYDSVMSAEHALILCRGGRYELYDLKSSNGTFVNARDEMIPMNGVELSNHARIYVGSTAFTFVQVSPPPEEDAGRPAAPSAEPAAEPSPGPGAARN